LLFTTLPPKKRNKKKKSKKSPANDESMGHHEKQGQGLRLPFSINNSCGEERA
jgi:hypothetical protein